MSSIFVVSVGSDEAVFLNGETVCTFDPQADDSGCREMLEQVAVSLSSNLNLPIIRKQYDAPSDNWSWEDIAVRVVFDSLISYELQYEFIDADGECGEASSSFSAEDYPHAVEQLVAELGGSGRQLLYIKNQPDNEDVPVLQMVGESEFRLNPACDQSCCISVGNAAVYLKQTGEGIIVSIFPASGESANESVASTYAHYSECVPVSA